MDVCSHLVTVVDDQPPTFEATPATFCVETIQEAQFWPPTTDIAPTRPDYYTMKAGDITLDIHNLADNCCDPEDMTIHWRIDFAPTPALLPPHDIVITPPVSGTGQPSEYGADLLLPGDGVTFQDVIHKITYWVTDCNGVNSAEMVLDITIKPRPQVIKR